MKSIGDLNPAPTILATPLLVPMAVSIVSAIDGLSADCPEAPSPEFVRRRIWSLNCSFSTLPIALPLRDCFPWPDPTSDALSWGFNSGEPRLARESAKLNVDADLLAGGVEVPLDRSVVDAFVDCKPRSVVLPSVND